MGRRGEDSRAPTFEDGADLPDAKASDAEVLAEGQLQQEHRNPGKEQRQKVGDEEGTCREQDDVTEAGNGWGLAQVTSQSRGERCQTVILHQAMRCPQMSDIFVSAVLNDLLAVDLQGLCGGWITFTPG